MVLLYLFILILQAVANGEMEKLEPAGPPFEAPQFVFQTKND